MASIQKRGSSYRARITREGKSTLSATFSTKKDALIWAAETELRICSGQSYEPKKLKSTKEINFGEVANCYIKTHSIHKKNYRSEIGIIQRLIARWGNLDVQKIDKPLVMQLRDELTALGRSGSTINHYFNAISKIYQMLIEERELPVSNPIKGLRRLPDTKGRNIRVSALTESLLLDGCRRNNTYLLSAIIQFAIQTGMRRGEILRLSWSDVDIPNRAAYLNETKNGNTRKVPLTLKAIDLLSNLPRNDARVFPMGFHCLRSQFKRIKTYLKSSWEGNEPNPFNNLRFHDFRHEALSRLSDAGLNVIELSHISGHRTLGMLQRYTHPSHTAIFAKLDKQT